MSNLRTLNLADNCIKRIEGLSGCVMLDSLYLKRNRIGKDDLADLVGLLECPSLQCVELSNNYVMCPEALEEVFVKMPNLRVLYLLGNDITKKIKSYRKTVISKIEGLRYLDDRPVFEDDRRHAEAWARGGIDAEREERKKIKKEKDEKHERNHQAFKRMMEEARAARAAAEGKPVEPKEEPKTEEIVEDEKEDSPPDLEEVDLAAERAEQDEAQKHKEW